MTPHEQQRRERYTLRAAFYGLWLRRQGYGVDEAAHFVAERYPRLQECLKTIADKHRREHALENFGGNRRTE